MLRDHRVDDLNLAGVIGFFFRPVPQRPDVEFLCRGINASVNGDEEKVRRRFRDDADYLLVATCGSPPSRATEEQE